MSSHTKKGREIRPTHKNRLAKHRQEYDSGTLSREAFNGLHSSHQREYVERAIIKTYPLTRGRAFGGQFDCWDCAKAWVFGKRKGPCELNELPAPQAEYMGQIK
jgi:hypothetical protein